MRWLSRLFSFAFPRRCMFCRKVIDAEHLVCTECEESHPSVLLYKQLPKPMQKFFCVVPYVYRDEVRDAILRFKFRNRREYAAWFAVRMAEAIAEAELSACTHVTAVPLSKSRLHERGYNQAELLARELASILQLPYEESLLKVKENRLQHRLKADERKKNVHGVYSALQDVSAMGKCYLLVDDIITTGETLGECTRILMRAGADDVFCVCIAKR